jgi:tRNA(fMet)-specific endonuclease VapC
LKYFLDTNILIYLINDRPAGIAAQINSLTADVQLGMSFVSYAELLFGIERSAKQDENKRALEKLTKQIPVFFAASESLCQHYATQFARLKKAGALIGANDLWIACHALAESAILVTNNTREFSRITELQLENWALRT